VGQPIVNFGKFLESLRGSMSLREAARKSGLSHAYIRDLELERNRSTNDRITPSPDTLQKLSVAYGYPYMDLMMKAGHLVNMDLAPIPAKDAEADMNLDLKHVHYIEIGTKDATYYTGQEKLVHSIESLLDFSAFLDKPEEHNFKKLDADLYVNFNQIRHYDERRGMLFFEEDGTGPGVTISAIRQRKYHDLIVRNVAVNTSKSLEFTFGKSGTPITFTASEKNV